MADEQVIVEKKELEQDGETTKPAQVGYPQLDYPQVPKNQLDDIGKQEAEKTMAEMYKVQNTKFDNLVKHVRTVLLKIHTKKPFDFFPDELTITTMKISLSLRFWFLIRKVQSIEIKDITDISVETTPIYATLHILQKDKVKESITVKFLMKQDAKLARRIIAGLMVAHKEGIDFTAIPEDGLRQKLETLGEASEVETLS